MLKTFVRHRTASGHILTVPQRRQLDQIVMQDVENTMKEKEKEEYKKEDVTEYSYKQ